MKGELLDARDGASSSAGESCLRQVIEIVRRQESRWWELRATTSLADADQKSAFLAHLTIARKPICAILAIRAENIRSFCGPFYRRVSADVAALAEPGQMPQPPRGRIRHTQT